MFLKWKFHGKIIFVAILAYFCYFGEATRAEEDLTLSHSEKIALDKLKAKVVNKLPHDYMKHDIYLVKWLQARNFDPAKAEELLIANLKWRKDNKMDNILKEDWGDIAPDYPYQLDSLDKEGKPVMFCEIGRWDLRNADLTGRFKRLVRFGERIMEEEETFIRKLQGEGKLVTRVILVMDFDGFNFAQHMCSRCMSYILQFYNSFETHYPNMLDKLFIINNHPIVNSFMSILLANLAPETRQLVHLYSRNKAEYSQALLKAIDADQLPERYGGTKNSSTSS